MTVSQTPPLRVGRPQKLNGHVPDAPVEKGKNLSSRSTRYGVFAACALAVVFVAAMTLHFSYAFFLSALGDRRLKDDFFETVDNLPKNYASATVAANPGAASPIAAGKKFEKIGHIKSITPQFENALSSLKKTVARFHAVTQFEKAAGRNGQWESHFLIAVKPTNFDSFSSAVKAIGQVMEEDVTNLDKTSVYRQLVVNKASLQQSLASLSGIKDNFRPGGNLDLRDKILQAETDLLELETELAYFTAENDFCTLRFSLYKVLANRPEGFFATLKASFFWTVNHYPLLLVLTVALLLFKGFDKIRLPEINLGIRKT